MAHRGPAAVAPSRDRQARCAGENKADITRPTRIEAMLEQLILQEVFGFPPSQLIPQRLSVRGKVRTASPLLKLFFHGRQQMGWIVRCPRKGLLQTFNGRVLRIGADGPPIRRPRDLDQLQNPKGIHDLQGRRVGGGHGDALLLGMQQRG